MNTTKTPTLSNLVLLSSTSSLTISMVLTPSHGASCACAHGARSRTGPRTPVLAFRTAACTYYSVPIVSLGVLTTICTLFTVASCTLSTRETLACPGCTPGHQHE